MCTCTFLELTLRFLQLILFLFLINSSLSAQRLSVDTISANIQRDLQTKLTGQNKVIVQNLYERTGNKPLWIGAANKQKMSQLIQALNDPIYN